MNKEKYSDELCEILCSMDKIETLIKLLKLTLFENSDFQIQDCQNLCLIIEKIFQETKLKTTILENSANKSNCLVDKNFSC